MSSTSGRGQIRGVHVALVFAGFLAVVVGVNGVFLARAIDTFPGEVAEKSYLQGLDYNRTLERREAQRRLGWTAQAGVRGYQVVVRLFDREGAPVAGMDVKVRARLPGAAGPDAEVGLQATATGEYAGALPAQFAGRVDLTIEARRPGDVAPHFEASKRILVQ